MDGTANRTLPGWLTSTLWWVGFFLFVWGLSSILYQYQWYFPADFENAVFLKGRGGSFHGAYRWAFYFHLVTGPIVIFLAALLMLSGGVKQFRRAHRVIGRTLALVVLLGLLPSGILMATQSYAGPIAGWGFVSLAFATTACTTTAIIQAIRRRIRSHRLWAFRSFILLCSPLILRFVASSIDGIDVDPEWSYRMNAWMSWLVPLLLFEIIRKYHAFEQNS